MVCKPNRSPDCLRYMYLIRHRAKVLLPGVGGGANSRTTRPLESGYDQAIKIDSEFFEAVEERDAAVHKIVEKTGARPSAASVTAE